MGASVINVYFTVLMPANRLTVNHNDFMPFMLRSLVVRAVHRRRFDSCRRNL